jgi:hypothetical protein
MARQVNRPKTTTSELRARILSDFAALKIPLRAEQFDAALTRAEREGQAHLEFLHQLISEQAAQRRERSIAHRVRAACFRESKTLACPRQDERRLVERATGIAGRPDAAQVGA